MEHRELTKSPGQHTGGLGTPKPTPFLPHQSPRLHPILPRKQHPSREKLGLRPGKCLGICPGQAGGREGWKPTGEAGGLSPVRLLGLPVTAVGFVTTPHVAALHLPTLSLPF